MKAKFIRGTAIFLLSAMLATSADWSSLSVLAATNNTLTPNASVQSSGNVESDSGSSTSGVIFANSRTDFRDESIYFVMTTRFYDGDSSNNVQCWDGTQYDDPNDPEWRGDFKGLAEKLDYIKALGFTAIWITPVVENTSGYDYHGYHASNFSAVDSRYESDDFTYQDLIDAAHEKGLKIIQDVVFNHTGNFGEANLMPMFTKEGDLGSPDCLKVIEDSGLPSDYEELIPDLQYQARLALMKNTDGVNHDVNNLYHHYGNFNWDDYTSQLAQIAGDCVDLNTENPVVYNYLQDAYSQYIEMGVDAFRVDTTKHISRLTFNNALIEPFYEAAESVGNYSFYMFGEVCARDRNVWYRNTPALSTPFYTWKESKDYAWSETDWEVNAASAEEHYNDNDDNVSEQPTSNNAFLNGNEYHDPDYSESSGLGVIDFPMHWNFASASDAYRVALTGDQYYNDATWNVTYVDSHDYAPDTAPEGQRFNQSQDTWAENLSLMFTFRGIPCIYYGSEIEFMKGAVIDKGPNIAIGETGRAYFGDYIEGSIDVTDFAEYTNVTGNMAETLSHPLAQHIQRLNQIRQAVPALRKGQYSTEGVSGSMAYKRRYTDDTTDSFALVTVSSSATFSDIPNGTYVDCVTGDVKTVTNGTLTAECSGKGNIRVYVLNTDKTPAPGKIGTDGTYIYSSGGPVDPIIPVGSDTMYFEKPDSWGTSLNAYIYGGSSGTSWPGVSMTLVEGNVYKVNYSGSSGQKVIFNDGTNQIPASQEPGFDVVKNGYYSIDGYQKQYGDDNEDVAVTGVTLNKLSGTVSVGSTITLSATVAPSNATDKTITWISNNTSVATVSNGVVTGIAPGTAKITATSSNGKSAVATITVTKGSGDITVPEVPSGASIVYFERPSGWNDKLYAYIYNTNGSVTEYSGNWPGASMTQMTSDGIYYYIINESVAAGTNVIFNDGNNQVPGSGQEGFAFVNNALYTTSGQQDIIEPAVAVTNIILDQTSVNLTAGNTITLTATVEPSNATDKTVTWSSNNTSVATVSNGVVTAKSEGSAVITAKSSNGKTATAIVTVSEKPEITKPVQVTGVTAELVDGAVQLHWEDAGALQYKVSRSDGRSGYVNLTYSAGADGYLDTAVTCPGLYYYRITGYFKDAEGNLVSGELSESVGICTAEKLPDKVVNLTAAVTEKGVVLNWDASDGAQYYKLSRASGTTGAYYTLKYGFTDTAYTDLTVSAGRYRYKAVAYYKDVDGSFVYGELSDTLYVTVK